MDRNEYAVFRDDELLGIVRADSKENAIRMAQKEWCFKQFGLIGAMAQEQIVKETNFFEGRFSAICGYDRA